MSKMIHQIQQFLFMNPWVVMIAALVLLVLAVILPKRFKIPLLVAYVLFIVTMTLLTRKVKQRPANWDPLKVYEKFIRGGTTRWEVIYNVVLFIPLGAMISSVKPKLIWTAIALSICIELIQLVFGLGECELGDVILNGAGSFVGAGISSLVRKVIQRTDQQRLMK